MSDQPVTVGRIVHYQLSPGDVERIEHVRAYATVPMGGPRGNAVHVGDVFPAIVVRAHADGTANLQVLLDGPDTHWVTSRTQTDARHENIGPERGCWFWPPRVG